MSQTFGRLLGAGDPRQGPLPVLLLALTVVTGLVDAVSFLALGRVFVANMTGNVVVLGFAVAGTAGFSILASVVAIFAFLGGAAGGGYLARRAGTSRIWLLSRAIWLETALVILSLALSFAVAGNVEDALGHYGLILLLGLAMGMQNAVARRLAVPDMTTTVLTLTLTGIAADGAAGGVPGSWRASLLRRLRAVLAMFIGAAVGAFLLGQAGVTAVLVVAAGLLVIASLAALPHHRSVEPWAIAG
ncbi:YoaK family protein [Radicibacter daui]|uniref:YoaK family protein n=1 Tax=Radicibacter daui TaxID=3064829 RepID=UPI004046E04F